MKRMFKSVFLSLPALLVFFCIEPACAKDGDGHFQEELVSMDFIPIPGGAFNRGDFTGQGLEKEKPSHPVKVSGFFFGATEVTVRQFRSFTEATGFITEAERAGFVKEIGTSMGAWKKKEGLSWRNPGYIQSQDDPVVWVTWNDADAFAKWLAGKSGKPYRLPTEAEWEYAARERGMPVRWSGTSDEAKVGSYAWFAANSGGRPHPVGTKEANLLGLHDMSGNVWEWCLDWQEEYRPGGSFPTDPAGPAEGEFKVLRGGSWRVDKDVVRTTYRNGYRPDYAHSSIGFRLALPGKNN